MRFVLEETEAAILLLVVGRTVDDDLDQAGCARVRKGGAWGRGGGGKNEANTRVEIKRKEVVLMCCRIK